MVIWSFESNATSHDFIKNNGQWEDPILFEMRSNEGIIRILHHTLEFYVFDQFQAISLHQKGIKDRPVDAHFWKVHFLESNSVEPLIEEYSKTRYHFFLGNEPDKWESDVNAAKSIIFPNFYNGIDFRIYSHGTSFKYEFIVHPGGDPNAIKWTYEGIDPTIAINGDLCFVTSWKTFYEEAPYCFQTSQYDKNEIVNSTFQKFNSKEFGFSIGDYDHQTRLNIDPGLVLSTFISEQTVQEGGVSEHPESGYLIALSGNIDILAPTPGAIQAIPYADLFIIRLNADLTEIIWIAQFGGSNNERVFEIEASHERISLVGRTNSTDIPTTENAVDSELNGGAEIFLASLSLDGSMLIGSTYLGTNSIQKDGISKAIAFNNEPELSDLTSQYVADIVHTASSTLVCFTSDASLPYEGINYLGSMSHGENDIVLTSLTIELDEFDWVNIISSNAENCLDDFHPAFDAAYSIELLNDSTLTLLGSSNCEGLPSYSSTLQPGIAGKSDGWIALFDVSDGSLIRSTYIGTEDYDDVQLATADSDSTFLVIGRTEGIMPVTTGAIAYGSGRVWIARIKNDLSEILTLASIGEDVISNARFKIHGFHNNPCGSISIVLQSSFLDISDEFLLSNLPVTEFQEAESGPFYLASFNRDLSEVQSGAYMGGVLHDGRGKFNAQDQYLHFICSHSFDPHPAYQIQATPGTMQPLKNSNPQINLSIIDISLESLSSEIEVSHSYPCLPNAVSFYADGNAESYLWDLGDGSLINGSEIEYEFIESGTYSAKLIVSSTHTCNPVDTIYFELNIPEPPPSPVADFDVLNFEPCQQEQSVELSFNGIPGTNMQWELPDSSVIENTLQTNFEIHSAGSFDVFLVVEDSICGLADSLHQTLVVHDPLIVNWSEPAYDPCLSEQIIELELSASGQEEIYWTLPDGGSIQNAQLISYLIDSPGDYLFELVVIDTDCDQSQSFSFVANVQGPLDASWEYLLPDPCSGEPIFASFTGQGADQLTWTFPDSSQILEANEIEAGTMTGQSQSLMLWAQSQLCGQDSLLTVEFSTGTPMNISVTNDLIQDDPCHEGVFMAEVHGSGFDSILWTDEFGNSSDQSSFSQAYPAGTETSVNLTVNNPDCDQVYSEDFMITVSSSEPLTNFEIPNVFSPQKDGVNDTYRIPELADLNPEDVISFKIFNRWGGLVLEQYGVLPHWDGTFQGEEAASGVYFFTLEVYDNCSGENYRRSGEIQLLR